MANTERDERIIEFLDKFTYATTTQLASVFFNDSLRAAQIRLKKLRESKAVRYVSIGKDYPFIYCLHGQHSRQVLHHVAIVEAFRTLRMQGVVDFTPLLCREFKFEGKPVRFVADAFFTLKMRGGAQLVAFLEIERKVVRTSYSKVAHYEAFYLSGAYKNEWWYEVGRAQGRDVFPRIVVQTGRPEKYAEVVRQQKNVKLPWQFVSAPGEILKGGVVL